MRLDKLRSLLIFIWLGGGVIAAIAIGIELVMSQIEPKNVEPLFRNLLGAISPALGLMISLYFVPELSKVTLTKGQKQVSIVLSLVYILAIVLVTIYVLYFGSNLTQSKGNSYEMLLELQSIIIGIIAYIFGKSQKK